MVADLSTFVDIETLTESEAQVRPLVATRRQIAKLTKLIGAEQMDCYRVSKLVNAAKNDTPEVLEPA